MLLAIDVGNTEIKLSVYNQEKLECSFALVTKEDRTHDELGLKILDFLSNKNLLKKEIASIIVASVVPTVNDTLYRACQHYLDITPRFLQVANSSKEALKIPLEIKIDHPPSLGADRIAACVGAIHRYPSALIVVNFGTATVCDVVDSTGAYIGGTIAPGINTSIKTLHNCTSLLPMFRFCKPSKTIATSTEDALYSGVFYGTIGGIEKILQELKNNLQQDVKVVATGGLAKIISAHTDSIDIFDEDLTTFGLCKIHSFNN